MLVAGYSRNTARKGLKTYMPDYDDLQGGREVAHTPGAARRAAARHAAQKYCPCPTAADTSPTH